MMLSEMIKLEGRGRKHGNVWSRMINWAGHGGNHRRI
jgi:hypothetical protein